MTKRIKIFSYKDIPVYIHWSFSFIVLYILYVAYSSNLNLKGTGWLSLITLIFFVCVILHEFGHALMARRFGIKTQDIVLTPIGGVARLIRIPKSPKQELWVALAGPVVNIGIALVLVLLLLQQGIDQFFLINPYDINVLTLKEFVYLLMAGNLFLALFNLLPAFPMDGGRILRATLAMFLTRKNATKWASRVGRIFALLFIAYGLIFTNYILAFIGVFVFLSAGSEYRQLIIDEKLQLQKVKDLYTTDYKKLQASQKISTLKDLKPNGRDYLVFDEQNKLMGILASSFLAQALENNQQGEIGDLVLLSDIRVSPEDQIQKTFLTMKKNNTYTLPVYDNDLLIGAVFYEDIISV